jgi:hypothetical protein
MHRSGTSLIAELIHRWGAFGRVEECLPSNQWNERGYWELAPLVDFNRRLLRQVGANWSCPPNQDRDSDLAALAQRPEFRKEALRLISSMNGEFAGTWFWKDPRLSLLLPFWQELWDNPRYVICLRDPFEICRSLEKRDGLSFSVSMMLWHRYMLSILERTRNRNTLILSYSQMIRTPKQECERLARFLSDQSGHGHPARAAVEMQKAVSAELRHYQADSYMPFTLMTRRQRNLQEVLEILSHSCNLSSLDLQGCSLPPAWRALLRADLLLLRCRKRWNRMLPGLAIPSDGVPEGDALAASYTYGLSVLDVNNHFSSHSGLMLDALLKNNSSRDSA